MIFWYKERCRCKQCGKVYSHGIPKYCKKCGTKLGVDYLWFDDKLYLTDDCEKIVAKRTLLGWKVKEQK
jgi:hypothetical protein